MRLVEKDYLIKSAINPCRYIGSEILYLDTTDSTMEDARKLIEQETADGTVIIAEQQTAGKGRYNRNWFSPFGGVYLSIILFREIELKKQGILSLMAGVASCEAIRNYLSEAEIKWPNDILINGKKISGILTEKLGNYYIIGTGINTNTDKFEGEFMLHPTSIHLETGKKIDNDNFIISLLSNFDENYNLLVEKQYEKILEKWKSMSTTIGRTVSVRNPMLKNEEKQVTIKEIDENGFLITSSLEKIVTGEIFY
ncbi:biotin--[acetyl-CoA-carboxylase] ligase [Candidatus Pacearchaeota archaeon]|nr:biotin--[acetyl-CoA-carboxylase] ligase [Candidatus Pacearchaeota archaeon]